MHDTYSFNYDHHNKSLFLTIHPPKSYKPIEGNAYENSKGRIRSKKDREFTVWLSPYYWNNEANMTVLFTSLFASLGYALLQSKKYKQSLEDITDESTFHQIARFIAGFPYMGDPSKASNKPIDVCVEYYI